MFLHILATIGIVLLCIAAFVILVLLLVLFMPIKYAVFVDGKDADISASLKIKWLFGFVRVCAEYKDSKLSYKASVLFISILKGEIGGESGKENKDEDEAKELSKKEIKRQKKKEEKADKKKAAKEKKKADKKETENKKKALAAEKKETEETPADNGILKEKLLDILEKIKNIWEKVKTIKYIWDAPVTKRAISFLKQKIFSLLNHIKPRKIKGRVKFALSDPAMTAQIYAVCAMLLEMMRADLVLFPDFDRSGFEAENVEIKGRIFAGYMLLWALQIIKNKDVRRVIKYIRRNL